MSTPVTTPYLYSLSSHWFTDGRWLYSHQNVWITVKGGLVRTKGSWDIVIYNITCYFPIQEYMDTGL